MAAPGLTSAVPATTIGIDDPRWRELADTAADASPFHHPAWASLVAQCYGFRTFVVAIEGIDGELDAGLPVVEVRHALRRPRWVALPFTDALPILARSASARDRLVGALAESVRRGAAREIEMRTAVDHDAVRCSAPSPLHRRTLDGDADAVFTTIAAAHRRNVRTAADVADRFYALQLETRRRQGVPVQPRRYFRLLWERVIEPGLGFVLLAEHDGEPVAGGVFLAWNDTVVYKYGASRSSAWSLRPNDLVMWRAIERAVDEGRRSFDFGRTHPANAGLRRFKRGWGAEEQELRYATIGPARSPVVEHELDERVRAVLRRSPPFLTRAAGELLYRFAA